MRAEIVHAARARASDLTAVFAVRPFALYSIGNVAMTNGLWMQRIALGWVVWELTGSEAWLGLVAFAELFPSIFTALFGGWLADRYPSTRVMFWGQVAGGLAPLTLAILSWAGLLTPTLILVLMCYFGAVMGALLPARLAMASYLAPTPLLPAALAVNSMGFNVSRLLGPALAAGLLIWASAALVFALAALSFLVLCWTLHAIRHVPRQAPAHPPGPPVDMARVLADLVRTPAVFGVILLQLAQGVLIRPASELFPAYAEVSFGRGADGLGLLNAALGAGAIIGAVAFTRTQEGRAALVQILSSAAVFAASLLVFAVTGVFWLALLVLVVHGAAMTASNIAALAYVQIQTPPERLGRVLSLYTIVFRVAPALGAFTFGVTAEVAGLTATGLGFGIAGLAATGLLALLILRPRVALS
ncbi:MAG: MFS transporter [Pseudomonadota bacterium]